MAVLPAGTVAPGPTPGTALAMGVLPDVGAVVTDEGAFAGPAVVTGAVAKLDAPSAARPVAAIESRLPLRVVFV